MKKLLRYKSGGEFIVGGIVSILPGGEPTEVFDLSALTDEEIEELRKKPKDKKLWKKIEKFVD